MMATSVLPALLLWNKRMNVPTLLTIARILLTPFIVYTFAQGHWTLAFAMVLVAGITDVLDGFLARRWNCQTTLGAALDPVADKILLLSCFAALACIQAIPVWFFVFMLAKELVLVLGVFALWLYKGSVAIAPTRCAKITTLIQILFVVWVIACYCFGLACTKTYLPIITLLLFLSCTVLVQYAHQGWLHLTRE
jgi:cardiolipin synthase (CMP-forming)